MVIKKVIIQPGEAVTGYHLKTVQDNTEQAFNQLANLALTSGNFITTSLVSGNNTIIHGLNREYQGFIVTLKNDLHDVYLSSVANNLKNKIIILHSTGIMNATIYIF